MTLRTVGVRLQAEVSGYAANMRAAKGATKDFMGELDKSVKGGKSLDNVANSAGLMGAAMTAAFGGIAMVAADFDKQMSAVEAATHASGEEMQALRDKAIEMTRTTKYMAVETGQGIEELAKAGVETADILGGGLAGALDLAAAGEISVAEAAETAASAMTQFKLSGSSVPHIADMLAAGANKAQGGVHDLGFALSQGGLVASQMGLSIEETIGTLTAFASAGLMGSDAGTSLKTALIHLSKPLGPAKELMEELGLSAYDASGEFVGMASFAGQLREKLGDLTSEQRNSALATIFGTDAIRAASIWYEQGEEGIAKWIDAVDDSGYASETAAIRMNNLQGDLDLLTASMEALAIESGGGANEGLRALTQSATAFLDGVNELPPVLTGTVTVLIGVGGAALLLTAGMLKAKKATADMLGELRATGPMGTRAAAGIERTQKAAGKAAKAFIAMEVAAVALRVMSSDLNPQIESLGRGLADWAKQGEKGGEAARLLGKDFEHLSYDLGTLGTGAMAKFGNGVAGVIEGFTGMGDVMDESLTHAKERIGAIDSALAQMVDNGKAREAGDIFEKLVKEAKGAGISVDDLKKGLPQYAAAIDAAANKTDKAAGAIGGIAGEAESATASLEDLKKAFDNLFGVEMDLDRATIAYKNGVKELSKELKGSKRTLDENTQAGRDNRSAVLDQIEKIKTLRESRIAHNGSVDEANAKYKAELNNLKATLRQMGYNETEIEALIGKYKKIPDEVATVLTVDTAEGDRKIIGFKTKINKLDGRVITVTARFTQKGDLYIPGQGTQLKNRWGGVYQHAAVGALRDAHIASPVATARYAYAEQATGGELFAPKYGDMNRTRAMVGYAVENWWGGWQNFAPQAAGARTQAPSSSAPPEVRVFIGDRELTDLVRVEVSEQSRDLVRRVSAGME